MLQQNMITLVSVSRSPYSIGQGRLLARIRGHRYRGFHIKKRDTFVWRPLQIRHICKIAGVCVTSVSCTAAARSREYRCVISFVGETDKSLLWKFHYDVSSFPLYCRERRTL
ncbi:hypothetical protein KIL84_002844 [Mauremys mutica]|uniref:Uncharacterized protein n=1 Tax=Mauremys mutica TaxID=74926 RepID=A0A9D3WSY0_9SAUR|nr:hypothetical protein KIL84_002844 [Mauremys mutica]